MTRLPLLTYTESSLPGAGREERFASAREHRLALEVANDGGLDEEALRRSGLRVATVQAYRMHEFHPLHRDPARRRQAAPHVRDTLEAAARLGTSRIVAACGFGHDLADRPFERCLDFFGPLAGSASALGVRIMIEPLSPSRTAAMASPAEIVRLLAHLDRPDVFSLVLDTGHLADAGFDLEVFFREWDHPVEELQLKGPASAPPSSAMPVEKWLKMLPETPDVLCVEHRKPVSRSDMAGLIGALRESCGIPAAGPGKGERP
jgi:hypothetical protein